MNTSVTVNRNKYIGGSDIPIIMNLSPFKKRFDLLLEKAELKENEFSGNAYTEYGNVLEPQIRNYINEQYNETFEPDCIIKDDLRGNMDGYNGHEVLEIKTTTHIYDDISDYKVYLVQLLFYMKLSGSKTGKLAVYERPDNWDEKFDEKKLAVYEIKISEYTTLLEEISSAVNKFRADLKRMADNPLLSEEDFQPDELVELSNKVIAFERQLESYKTLEKQYEEIKQQLFEAMQKHNVASWETAGGIKIAKVDAVPYSEEIIKEFDVDKFVADNPETAELYTKSTVKRKSGRKGYVRITMPKGI